MTSLRTRLADRGQCLLGTFVKFPCIEAVELLGIAGFDFVVFDMEHSPLNLETVSSGIVAARSRGLEPLVRVPDHGHAAAVRVLDAGAAGVFVPHVSSVEEARRVAGQLLFEPRGTRGLGSTARAGSWGLSPVGDYLRWGNEEAARVLMVEDRGAIEALPGILDVEGVDAIFVGLGDLSVSLGYPGQMQHPEVQALLDRAVRACAERGVGCGVPAGGPEAVAPLVERGVTFVLLSNDASLFGRAAQAAVSGARAELAKLQRDAAPALAEAHD
jgi:2-dehydro-3-deoxyglucarate aldolase/4-hydroxy-2-oxoheptanedioate aldolase